MEIILSKQCKSLSGTLSKLHGYYIQKTRSGQFITIRKQGTIPPDGHLSCIFDFASMAGNIIVADINVFGFEVNQALDEAGYDVCAFEYEPNEVYHAEEMLALKERLKL